MIVWAWLGSICIRIFKNQDIEHRITIQEGRGQTRYCFELMITDIRCCRRQTITQIFTTKTSIPETVTLYLVVLQRNIFNRVSLVFSKSLIIHNTQIYNSNGIGQKAITNHTYIIMSTNLIHTQLQIILNMGHIIDVDVDQMTDHCLAYFYFSNFCSNFIIFVYINFIISKE